MDTTPKYILMCEKAEEVQKAWQLTEGDCVAYPPDKIEAKGHFEWFNYNDADAWETEELKKEHSATWLPRQDQLQEMLGGWDWACVFLRKRLVDKEFPTDWPVSSMEQLWLAFVMQEKYQKHWDQAKEEWVIEKQINLDTINHNDWNKHSIDVIKT
jgi:hypothetical protein